MLKIKHIYKYVKQNNIDIICFNEYTPFFDDIMIKYNKLFEEYNKTSIKEYFISDCNIIFYKKNILIKELFNNVIIVNNNVHIMAYRGTPGKEGKKERLDQINKIVNFAKNKKMIVIGDTNARINDYDNTEINKYFYDCWIEKGHHNDKYTMNLFENEYYGKEAFKYTSRYDRAYITKNIKNINKFEIIFKDKYEDLKRYNGSGCISDHYGLLIDVDID